MPVTPPVMPKAPLPPLPQRPTLPQLPQRPAGAWVGASNPSAHIVQKQYVDTRLEELEHIREPQKHAALLIIREKLLQKLPFNQRQNGIPVKELLRVYEAIERNLQSAELTVNFAAETWFINPNPYDTYTQMYQRSITGSGQMVMRDHGAHNANQRAEADNAITFPQSWQQAKTAAHRGLMPGRQSRERIQTQMDTGPCVDVTPHGDKDKWWLAGNKHFNPHTKQVFLALNYGRRPHGSSHNYGYSWFVAKKEIRQRCLYYAKDTFYKKDTPGADAGKMQFAYTNLGAILGDDDQGMVAFRNHVWDSCYEGKTLPDVDLRSNCQTVLLEGHHFGELNFREHIDHMVISPILLDKNNKNRVGRDIWVNIVANAKAFCQRNGIKLYQTE